jgi:hypothetical protein
VIERGMLEFGAWWSYFNELGWRPHWLTMVNRYGGSVTMPAQWPIQFDASAPPFVDATEATTVPGEEQLVDWPT